MKILDDILNTLKPNGAVSDVRQGRYWTAVVTNECGLASTPHESGHSDAPGTVLDTAVYCRKPSAELVSLAYSTNPLEAAVGMAAVNSLLDVDETRCINLNAAELIREAGRGRKVAVVGHFPFVDRIRNAAAETWVIERAPREDDLGEEEAARVIPQADVIAITGSAFVNHSIEALLALCPKESYVIVLGPTTPLSSVLFEYGADVISGTRVADTETVLRQVDEGLTFRQMTGVRLLTMKRQ